MKENRKDENMRYLLPGLMLLSLSFGVSADNARDKNLRQFVGDSSNAARLARLGKSFSTPCSCAEGAELPGTKGLVFNCSCGLMQCVVVASSGSGSGASETPNVVCR